LITTNLSYAFLASAVLITHTVFIVFVVVTLPLIFIGKALHWRWIRRFWLRALHLICMGIVAAQAWAGMICPLTTLEMYLRAKAGLSTYEGNFIAQWLQILIYWDLPVWVFTALYTLFTLLVVLAWYVVPPERGSQLSMHR
jgi:hypothetical protein